MRAEQHLMLNAGIIGASLTALYLSNIDISGLNMIHLGLAVYIFSNLPDIDNANSKISNSFFLFYAGLFIYGIVMFMQNMAHGFGLMSAALLLGLFHLSVAKNSRKHRGFLHTFTFGMIMSLLLWYLTSWIIAVTGFFCFAMHIVEDRHVKAALRRDLKIFRPR